VVVRSAPQVASPLLGRESGDLAVGGGQCVIACFEFGLELGELSLLGGELSA
jgi:hypothetical protein